MLADDTPDVRALLRLVLGRAGYDIVGEAANGAEAVELAGRHQPDVVIVDLAMPVMDGLEAIPLIRKEAPDAKVVVFSGFTSERIEADALAAGADAFMEKGTPPAQLLATVAGVVSCAPPELAVHAPASPQPSGVQEDLSFVVHELMSPLTVIEGFASMMEERGDKLSPDEIRDYSGRITRSAVHLRALIQAVADARRVEGGSLRIERELLDVGVFVRELVAELGAITAPHPVEVDADCGLVVWGDPVRLRQVLTNLLSNAAKFSGDGQPITVRVAGRGGVAEVAVADCGPGIPAERRGELFGRYARLGSPAPGMGVGLYISRGIARAHGGDLRLADTPEGHGACFVLSLPRADAGASP